MFLDLLNEDVVSDHYPLYRSYLAVGQMKKGVSIKTSVNLETGTTDQLIFFFEGPLIKLSYDYRGNIRIFYFPLRYFCYEMNFFK